MRENERKDGHSPKSIVASDYEFVGVTYLGNSEEGFETERAYQAEIREASNRYGYGQSDSAGTCDCCGALALYLGVFLHMPSEKLHRFGEACSAKLEMGHSEAFRSIRRGVKSARMAKAGKQKAALILEDLGLSEGWEKIGAIVRYELDLDGVAERAVERLRNDARVLGDLRRGLEKWGNLSDKQVSFMRKLHSSVVSFSVESSKAEEVERLEKANSIEIEEGRQEIEGEVVSVKEPAPYDAYPATKILVVRGDGAKFYGSAAKSIGEVEKGDRVSFSANVKVKEAGFAFFSRPTGASIV
jgi:hypothetical protein